jgi:hypothetical protein
LRVTSTEGLNCGNGFYLYSSDLERVFFSEQKWLVGIYEKGS